MRQKFTDSFVERVKPNFGQATADWIAAAMAGRKPRLGEKFRPDQIPQGPGAKEASA